MRLDDGELAVAELPETPGKYAIVPGNPERSELIRRITSSDVDVRMPPESEHKRLTAVQIEILRQWIENGAEYRPHWAFIKPERPTCSRTPPSRIARRTRSIASCWRGWSARESRRRLRPTKKR